MLNKIIAITCLAFCATSAYAETTLEDIRKLNADLKLQEIQAKISDLQDKNNTEGKSLGSASTGSMPAIGNNHSQGILAGASVSESTAEPEEIKLIAIYGVGTDLKAEVLYNGNSFTLSKLGGNNLLGSWTVSDITPYKLFLTKPTDSHKKGKNADAHKEVFLASSSTTTGDTKNLNLFASPGTASGFPGSANGLPLPPTIPATANQQRR